MNVYIPPVYKLAKDIVKAGWLYGNSLCSNSPEWEPKDCKSGLGIYREIKTTIEPCLFGIFKRKRYHQNPKIGMIWISNGYRGAIENKSWVLEVFGEQHINSLTKFMEEVCPVEFVVRLESYNEYSYQSMDY